MTKLNAIKIIKDVMDGTSGHTYGIVYKVGRSWKVETSINRIESEGFHFQHCCNEITIKEVNELLAQNHYQIENNYYNSCNCPKDEYSNEYHR